MTEPHPLRCETCEYKNKDKLCPAYDVANRVRFDDLKVADDIIRCIGCSSHSAATSAEKVLDEEDVLYPVPLRENRIKIQSIAELLMNSPQKISNSANPSYILNHVGKALSYLMRNDVNGDVEYKAIKNMMKSRQECQP